LELPVLVEISLHFIEVSIKNSEGKDCTNEQNIKFTLMFYHECSQGSPKASLATVLKKGV